MNLVRLFRTIGEIITKLGLIWQALEIAGIIDTDGNPNPKPKIKANQEGK